MIICDNVQRRYRSNKVLTNISFSIEEPKIVALVGHNGAGKSTLLRLLAGRLKPNNGDIRINNVQPFQNLQVATNSILIEENMVFANGMSLQEHFQWAKKFYPNWQQEIAENLCHYAQLNTKAHYNQLSKGQAATFRLIYGLCTRCAYTYLDEPMNGMDEGIRDAFYRVILKEYIAAPRTFIVSTHYLNEIRHLVEEVLIIHDGQIRMHSAMETLDTYALHVSGSELVVEDAISDSEILNKVQEHGYIEAVVVAEKFDVEKARELGLQVRSIEAHVVSRYLTSNRQGGIENVYK